MEGLRVDVLDVKKDERGWLAEIMRSDHLPKGVRMSQLFVTVGNPGKTKGKHYHKRKTEWFSVVSGKAKLHLKDVRTGEERIVSMGEKNLVTVSIAPQIAHAITSVDERPFCLIVVASEDFDANDPDTFPFEFPEI